MMHRRGGERSGSAAFVPRAAVLVRVGVFACAIALVWFVGGRVSGQSDPFLLGGGGVAAAEGETIRTSVAETFFMLRHPLTRKVEWFGTLIIWFLLLLSVSSLGLLGGMAWRHRRDEIVPMESVDRMRRLMREQRHQDVLRFAHEDRTCFGAVLRSALGESSHGYGAMIRAGEQSAEEETVRRYREIEPLNIIGNVAPMIGLFGTVYGMILAFREIVAAGGTPDPVQLAAGIGTALTTTFWGLVVAIPALAGYALLRTRIDGLTVEAARAAEEIVGMLRPGGAPEGGKAAAGRKGAA